MPILKNLFLLFSLLLIGCTVDTDRNDIKSHVMEHEWKYGEGFHIGDWLDFSINIYKIKGDTILRGDSAIAIVKKIEIGGPGNDDELYIISMQRGEWGMYHSK